MREDVLPPGVHLRARTASDLAFLFRVYAATRESEQALLGWDDGAWHGFLQQQFAFQHEQYQRNYANPAFDVIVVDGQPAGRLYVNRAEGEIRVVDIALLPEFRRRGVGGALLHRLLNESERSGERLGLHVERDNPIQGYYLRLGFRTEADKGVYLYMVRRPTRVLQGQGT